MLCKEYQQVVVLLIYVFVFAFYGDSTVGKFMDFLYFILAGLCESI